MLTQTEYNAAKHLHNRAPTYDDYVAQETSGAREHYDKYEALALQLGVGALSRLVAVKWGEEKIRAALETDEHLNNLPLAGWDSLDYSVRQLAARAGIKSWSLCETVCVAKHVARHHVAEAPRP